MHTGKTVKRSRALIGLLGVIPLSACATLDVSALPDAVLISPNSQVQTELRDAVISALGNPSTQLSADSLTLKPSLYIQLATPPGIMGERIMGRRMDTPKRFKLKISGTTCWLLHEDSGQSYALKSAVCRAV